jgi:hypothetical protein
VEQLRNGKRTGGIYTPIIALNTESVATFITTYCLRKVSEQDKRAIDGDHHIQEI